MALEELAHAFHRYTFGFWRPQTQNDEAAAANQRPEDIRSPHVEADEHVRGDSDNSELEEPVQRHAGSITHAADSSGEDFRPVQVLDGAETNTPAGSVDEHRRDRRIRSRFVACHARLQRHVHRHVYVRCQL